MAKETVCFYWNFPISPSQTVKSAIISIADHKLNWHSPYFKDEDGKRFAYLSDSETWCCLKKGDLVSPDFSTEILCYYGDAPQSINVYQ